MSKLLSLACALLLVASVAAQAPTIENAKAAPVVPKFDELDQAWIETVALAAKTATGACDGLAEMKSYQAIIKAKTTQIEARHPGYRMDWTSRALVAKAAAATK